MKKKWNKRLHTPSLYLCTNVTGCIATPSLLLIAFLMPHCPVTFVQRYRDGVCSLLFHLFFIICHPYIPLHLEETIFYTCFTDFWLCQCTYHIGAKKRFLLYMQLSFPSSLLAITDDTSLPLFSFFFRYAARGDRTRTAPLRRYTTNLYAMLHSQS